MMTMISFQNPSATASRLVQKAAQKIAVVGTIALALGATGCLSWVGADQGAVTIINAVQSKTPGPACATPGNELSLGTLDLAQNAGYFATLNVRTNLPATFSTIDVNQDRLRQPSFPAYGDTDANVITFRRATVFAKSAEGTEGTFDIRNPLAAPNDNSIPNLPSKAIPRISSVTGVVFNVQQNLGNTAQISVPAITPSEAEQLRLRLVGVDLTTPSHRVLIIVSMQLEGQTSGAGFIRSNEYSFPIALCAGCLVQEANCGAGQILIGDDCAYPGQDLPARCTVVN